MEKLELKHVQNYPMGKNGLLIQTPKHYFKYGTQISLPLNGVSINSDGTFQLELLKDNDDLVFAGITSGEIALEKCKLILNPLSDLTKEIEINGEKFVSIDIFSINYFGGAPKLALPKLKETFIDNILHSPIDTIAFGYVQQLIEWHFDVFGLIEKGLAIDINTLNK